ncbi:serine/threonine-protein kinase pakD-like [Melanaphis sacchari]|uniref:serine/threonine-protein kinase pakD-like n=1 Tax=Melanaphis sacchari TaxID=742174 RepID=UPI000DC12F7A|nr:serine/threonine-protein kinase pakD-like [Melanaphis sacchari]
MQRKNEKEEKKLLNCICEVNIDGKMGLLSLYDDLPHFEYDLTIDNLKNSITTLKTLNQELKQRIKQLENENTHLKSVNMVLSKNITSLFKTASSEIQRKDKMIDDLRKSQAVSQSYRSKMFSSNNDYQIEKTEVYKLSESKKNTEQIQNTVEKTKELNPNNNNITTIAIKPNLDIPKTVYYKRLCRKLAQKNETTLSIKQMPQHIENTITTDKIISDKNEEVNYDENILKEMTTSIIHNESKDINSTLVICESDKTLSDSELDTTPIIQCDNKEKDKENVSEKSFFSKLKQPAKLKKKLIITPSTIGVQNKQPKIFKSAKKLNQINISPIKQCEINNSPEKQIIKSLNKDTQSLSIKNNINTPEYNPKADNKPLIIESPSQKNNQSTYNIDTLKCTNNIIESKNSNKSSESSFRNIPVETSPANKTITTSPINIDVEKVPIKNKTNVIKNDKNTQNKFNKVTQSSCILNKNQETKYDSKTDNKLHSTDKLHDQQLLTSEKNNQVQSINIEVEQFPIRRRKAVIEKDNNTLAQTNVRKHSNVTCVSPSNENKLNKSTENVKCLFMNNSKESSSPSKQKNNQSTCNLDTLKCTNNTTDSKHSNKSNKSSIKNTSVETSPNNTVIPSISVEVEQVPITRKTNVLKKDDTLNKFNKVAQSSCILNKTKYDSKSDNKLLSTDKLPNQKLFSYENKNPISSINIDVEQVSTIRKTKVLESDNSSLNRLNKFTQEFKDHKDKCDSKMSNKHISTDILCNEKLSTCENKNQIPSVNIEVEQFPIRRRKAVIEKDNNTLALTNVRKRSYVTCMSPSNKNEFEYVKCMSVNNNRESSSPSQQKNSRSTCNLDTYKCVNNVTESKLLNKSSESSLKNTPVETSPTNKTVKPSINIEVEQGFIFRQSNLRKVIMHSTSDDKQETKKGRRVQLITIQDHYSEPVPSFNGAKKTDIDVSNKSILTEKVVESSSRFFVPQVKRRRTMNFGSADS